MSSPDPPDNAGSSEPIADERWIYGGIRVLDDKRVHAWLNPAGRELRYMFKRGGTWAIGSVYTARVSRTYGRATLHGTPAYTGDRTDDDDLRRRLWAEDTAARAQLALLTQERNDARRNAIDQALEPLIAAARQLKTGPDRDAFTAHVLRRLLAAWYRPPPTKPDSTRQ